MTIKHFDPDRPKKATDIGLGFGEYISLIKRNDWGAQERKNTAKLTVPATIVRFTSTGGYNCHGHETCVATIKDLERFHIESGLQEIGYNFMIGGNGVVYEGRGFDYQPLLPPEFAQLANTCIEIAFIGNFEFELPSYEMMTLALDLIRCGIKRQILSPNFDLVSLPDAVE